MITDIYEKLKLWNSLDTKLRYIQEKTKEMREQKQVLTDEVRTYLETFSTPPRIMVDENTEIQLYDRKETTTLSFSYIEKCLGEIIKEKSQVDYIINYLKDQRETTIVKELKRTVRKKNKSNI
jgi:hypothetical protein